MHSVNSRGFTLLETLLYLVLFSFLIGGGFLAAYQIIESSRSLADKARIEAEGNFVMRKIDWALNGYESISDPDEGDTGNALTVVTPHGTLDFTLSDGAIELEDEPLTTSRVVIEDFGVEHIAPSGGQPRALAVTIVINGATFGPVKRFLR